MISAKIICDSLNEFGDRLTTMEVVFPRMILSELNTHRLFSRNSASSRAIPFNKMVESVKNNPFIPIAWQKDHKGMQGTEYKEGSSEIQLCINKWLDARDSAVESATLLNQIEGVTKQLCNRLLEPFMYHKVLITATEWDNFFKLRCPQYKGRNNCTFRSKKDVISDIISNTQYFEPRSIEYFTIEQWLKLSESAAEIHIQALAEAMWDVYNESTPKQLKAGEYHIPYIEDIDYEKLGEATSDYYIIDHSNEVVDINKWLIKISSARCARISYTVVGEGNKKANYQNDFKLHDDLLKSGHMSPFEHIGRSMDKKEYEENLCGCMEMTNYDWSDNYMVMRHPGKGWSGNFKGFIQYRKTIE